MGYGFDPPTPLQTPGPMSQGALSQHFSIATPPHPQGVAMAPQIAVNPLIDPLTQADPWNNWSMQGSTIGRASTIGSLHPPVLSHASGISTPGGATASPCVGIGATPGVTSTLPQSGTPAVTGHGGHHTGGGHSDDTGARFKATPAKLPRLDLRSATDSSKAMLAVENWLWLCSNALNTWGTQAVTIWHNAHNQAKQQHALWCSYTPAQRSLLTSPGYQGFQMAPPLGIGSKRGGTIAEILELLFQRYLPSEPTARVDALTLLEVPLKTARSFTEGLRLLRAWKEQLVITIRSLHGRPDTYRMFLPIQP
eukprot:1521954-Amphidinium_carterae.2